MGNAEQIHAKMRASIENYDAEAAAAAAREAVAAGCNLLEAVEKGFAEPIRELGEAFDRMEVFLPQLMLGADAMKAGMAILGEAIRAAGGQVTSKGVVVIGTVAGDIHDIGKTVVAALLAGQRLRGARPGGGGARRAFLSKRPRRRRPTSSACRPCFPPPCSTSATCWSCCATRG